jgi:predicted ATPase
MISHFSVKDYKALESVSIPITPIHVLIGQNDSGKTSLLEAIHAFCSSTQGPLVNAFPGMWVGRELVRFGSESPRVELSAALLSDGPPLVYELGVDFPSPDQRHCRLGFERLSVSHEIAHDINRFHPDLTSVANRAHLPLEQRGEQDRIADMIGSSNLYRLDARMMAIPAAIDSNRRFRMDPDGFGLPTLLDDILGHEPERFIALRNEFRTYFPEFQTIHLETVQAATRAVQAPGFYSSGMANGKGICFETQSGALVRAQQASDGAILFLGFLALFHLPSPPKVLLIEEPETGVYPKRLNQIIEILKRMTDNQINQKVPQIIFTTHSPYVLSPFSPEEVTLMSRRNGSVIARPLRDAPQIKERLGDGEFYLGELWYNLEEEELFEDASPQPSS